MMRQVIGLVLLGMCCINALPAGDNDGTPTKGVSQSGRIINGVGAKIENHKYMISVRVKNKYACGAVIITLSHILTAAHCVYEYRSNPSLVTLYGGSTSPTTGGISISVGKVTVHPRYKPVRSYGVEFDIAVLALAKNALKGKTNMEPIALQNSEPEVGTQCSVYGWGRSDPQIPSPTANLRYAYMNIVSRNACNTAWMAWADLPITSNMICAKSQTGKDTCSGDSGGPLVCGGKLIGISSFTNKNCAGALPTGFTNIVTSNVRSFIESYAGI